ncbi:hypothetical protein FHS95_003776 [Sphingomonas naasensis]|uniref:Uncharacterized protein n=1 Tax=Sphingomonas naasensis TaxID=1344951 RepID=A0A4S1WGN4_9SPHN|nr:hypothetical protein [Sphingomonas naasensis]NIJ22065.1 hypothetical protein [Sphingomonas naasensis]TGX42261.1 hypothetical protein E5A74_10420 [Sphingomonas naasensis]
MNMEVRLGRKEVKRQRTARERQTYGAHKAASRGRDTVIRDFSELTCLLDKDALPDPDGLSEMIDTLIATYREGAGDTADHDQLIFDPDLADLSSLPVGVLDHKELPLPDVLIPRSRADLLALCERMIVRSRDPELIAYLVAGWPGGTASRRDIKVGRLALIEKALGHLHAHVDRLWHLSAAAPAVYAAIATGRHGTALKLLREKGPPKNFTTQVILDLIARQGLIWCCHDLQLILARSRAAAANPLGDLLSTTQIELKPERIANDLKPRLLLLRTLLTQYVTIDEETHPHFAKPVPQDLSDDVHARILGAAARHDLDLLLVGLNTDRAALDELVEYMRDVRGCADERVRAILDQPVTANELEAHFSGLWFSGLSHVQVAAVTILRYLQAETWIERLVGEVYPVKDAPRPASRDGTAMPPFVAGGLSPGWRDHARDLLHLYRREVLRDKTAPEPGKSLAHRARNAGNLSIEKALVFLRARSQRRIGDDAGDANSVERGYYLIDLIPEARLAR